MSTFFTHSAVIKIHFMAHEEMMTGIGMNELFSENQDAEYD